MNIRLANENWGIEFQKALVRDNSKLLIVCPFIRSGALEPLLDAKPREIRVITRFNLKDMAEGVSDIKSLRMLLAVNSQVKGIKRLHAKLYVFGDSTAIITSANLTKSAMNTNHEMGLICKDSSIIDECVKYFDHLWEQGSEDLKGEQVDGWDETLGQHHLPVRDPASLRDLRDYGADAKLIDPPVPKVPAMVYEAPQAIVKFLGESDDRELLTTPTREVIKGTGCHWAVSYPTNNWQKGVQDNAIVYIGQLTKGTKDDIRIFGRATGMKYVKGRDDATPAETVEMPFKGNWPHYIRLHHAEFVAGTLANGVSFDSLKRELRADSFATTQERSAAGEKDIDVDRAYGQHPHVRLTDQAKIWLEQRLQKAFAEHGKVTEEELDQIGWPDNV